MTSVETSDPVVAITFDDGPWPEITARLLAVFARHRARATFFMLGENARRYPEHVAEVASAGHVVGNHSWDHPSFPEIGPEERRRQIRECARALAPHGVRLFRPPFGDQTRESFLDAFLLGYQVVTWSVNSEDWLGHEGELIVKRVESETAPGSIILFHDGVSPGSSVLNRSQEQTLSAVDLLLDRLGGRFRFVTVPELLRHGRPRRVEWNFRQNPEMLRSRRELDGTQWRYHPAGEKADRKD